MCYNHPMTNPRRNEVHNQDLWFWPKVQKGEGCWLWQASTAQGYGLVQFEGRKQKAHRVSYMLRVGEIPADKPCVLHSCDNPSCVNPDHLFVGTKKDNTQDMLRKGRDRHNPNSAGERNGRAVLVRADVETLRSRYAVGDGSYASLAQEYGVTKGCIRDIVKKRTWQ
jgi:hypothetical protein